MALDVASDALAEGATGISGFPERFNWPITPLKTYAVAPIAAAAIKKPISIPNKNLPFCIFGLLYAFS
jgi:hypothetical protein